ncbi:MAG: hypothetical protein IIY55_13710 [Blautia sp.]|nr:hypothetical protein [Blautia sp.]
MSVQSRTSNGRKSAKSRSGRASASYGSRTYLEGNAVRKVRERTIYEDAPGTREPVLQEAKLSEAAKRNRERANGIGRGFVLFLVVISVAICFFCINYLKLQTQITAYKKTVAQKESELTQIREDNDAYYGQVISGVDLNAIKKTAIGKLGMRYPQENQIVYYETEGRSYVRQFQDIPD